MERKRGSGSFHAEHETKRLGGRADVEMPLDDRLTVLLGDSRPLTNFRSCRTVFENHATAQQPERQFWVAKWVVPQDTPVGIVRFTVTASDKYGRTGEFKPFEVQASQVTIVE